MEDYVQKEKDLKISYACGFTVGFTDIESCDDIHGSKGSCNNEHPEEKIATHVLQFSF